VSAAPSRFSTHWGAALPYLAIVVGVLALGFSALFVRWANAPGPVTGFYRMALATLFLSPLLIPQMGRGLGGKRQGIGLAILGGFFLALDLGLWNSAVNLTSAANATLFGNAAPIWVALVAALLFGERLRRRFWISLLLTMAGAALVLGADFNRHVLLGLGDLMALTASLGYAGYYLATQKGRLTLSALNYVWIAGASSGFWLLLISLMLRMPLTGYPPRSWLAFIGLALVTQTLGYVMVGYALGRLPASLVAPSMVGQPLVTALLAIPLLGERLLWFQWLGGAAVLIGIVMVHRSHAAASASTPPGPRG
jgi:drug/metabolite transporter (DMT)-like permease